MKLRAAVIFIADLGDGIPRAGGLDARPGAAGFAGVVVPLAGLEPARCCHHLILSLISDVFSSCYADKEISVSPR
jgi:hypothetical protein